MENYNFVGSSVWVPNLVSDIKGCAGTKGVRENRKLRRIIGPRRDEVI
jgi:hypothetical protein